MNEIKDDADIDFNYRLAMNELDRLLRQQHHRYFLRVAAFYLAVGAAIYSMLF